MASPRAARTISGSAERGQRGSSGRRAAAVGAHLVCSAPSALARLCPRPASVLHCSRVQPGSARAAPRAQPTHPAAQRPLGPSPLAGRGCEPHCRCRCCAGRRPSRRRARPARSGRSSWLPLAAGAGPAPDNWWELTGGCWCAGGAIGRDKLCCIRQLAQRRQRGAPLALISPAEFGAAISRALLQQTAQTLSARNRESRVPPRRVTPCPAPPGSQHSGRCAGVDQSQGAAGSVAGRAPSTSKPRSTERRAAEAEGAGTPRACCPCRGVALF